MPYTTLMPLPKQQFLSAVGAPLVGGKVYTYAAGTTDPKPTYTDAAGTVPQANPIVLNARGEPTSPVYWSGAYKVEVHDAAGNLIYTVDNFNTDPAGLWQILTQLAGNAGAGLIGFMQAGAGAVKRWVLDKLRDQVNGADFGMVADYNGADGTNNSAALLAALTAMKNRGGGLLVINPGDYYFGAYANSVPVVEIANLAKTRINAYGARFILNTTAESTPFLIVFDSPNDVVLAGASFFDAGFNPISWQTHSRWGMGAVQLKATTPSKGFKLEECVGENLTYLLVADHRANKRNMRDVVVEDCRLKNAYYGVDVLYLGDNLSIRNLVCEDVRRGLIGFGMRNFDADFKLYTNAGFLGSNAFISIACEGTDYNDGYGLLGTDGNVENGRVKLNVTGYEAHTAYVHFYHQQADSAGVIANIDCDVRINNLSTAGKNPSIGDTSAFLFDHELPNAAILGSTSRNYKQISLGGGILGALTGKPITFNSVNLVDPPVISISPNLTRLAHDYTINQFTHDVNILTPFERLLTSLVPVGDTTAGDATGLVCTGTWLQIGKRVFFNAALSWTGHTGTGGLRVNGLPKPADTAHAGLASIALTAIGLAHPAGTSLVALIGGIGSSQIIFYADDGTSTNVVPLDAAVGQLSISGSYVTP